MQDGEEDVTLEIVGGVESGLGSTWMVTSLETEFVQAQNCFNIQAQILFNCSVVKVVIWDIAGLSACNFAFQEYAFFKAVIIFVIPEFVLSLGKDTQEKTIWLGLKESQLILDSQWKSNFPLKELFEISITPQKDHVEEIMLGTAKAYNIHQVWVIAIIHQKFHLIYEKLGFHCEA